ncbi:DUF2975 domain-containing protein [Sphingopyxis panaciterrulae]|uniref:DUF2975 domain-containing protein n=1 Tax=Sphingopyxis panaciterrulae TaxID=462372 RepID=A0A7W9B8Q6_9SPHN|nr:DUF2975 domain-containing protein [Sphingopyxis panaciterrulae]MBB5708296.1 hypothetical protein [Sphingopyxis panaciterrulae]
MDNSQGKPLWLITRAALWLMTGLVAIATAILLWIIVRLSLGDGFGPDMDATAAPGLLPRLYLLGAMGLAALLMVGLILRKLLAMLTSLTAGHAFHAANAAHLRAVGWLMIGIQVLGTAIGFVGDGLGPLVGQSNLGFGFSLYGIVVVLLVFVLADVFDRGAAMRDDLEGTV